jgi:hypothetical protein
MMDMQPLYSIKNLYSVEEFMRFNRTLRFRNKKIVVFLSILDILLVALTVFCLINGRYIWAAIAGFYLVFLNWYLFRGTDHRMAKVFMRNTEIAGQQCEFLFFEDHFDAITKSGPTSIDYGKIKNIIETRTNVYIMYSDSQGIMMKKPMPEGFVAFLRGKCK